MAFNDFIKKHNSKNKATSNIKIQKVLSSLSLNDVGNYLKDGPFKSDIGIVNLHPSKGTHWVCYINENYFASYGCVCPKKLSKFILNGMVIVFYSEYKIQKNDSCCGNYCLYIIYLRKSVGIEFKSAVLDL